MHSKFISLGLIGFVLFLSSCNKTNTRLSDREIQQTLSGYWKIDQVERPEFNDIREYKFSTYAEYIEVDDNMEGFRIKLQPQLDSTYQKTSNAEKFKIKREQDSIRFYYETPMDSWKETLLSLDKDRFSVENERGFIYTYKRFESLKKELEAHEKKQGS